MVSATLTGLVISNFESALAVLPCLTAFIPMLMDTGGNAGSQACVTVIRGISLQEIDFRDILRVMWKETRVAVLCGLALAVACFAKVMLIDRLLLHNDSVTWVVALVVCLSMAFTVFMSKIVGCTLPLFAKKIGLDPAVMASPLITTIVDFLSLLVYFSFATAILHIG
jgi:magnesium transporter